MTNRETWINNARYWWNATPMSALGFSTYQDALAHYDKLGGNFVEQIGATLKTISQDRIKSAFAKLAKDNGSAYPDRTEFFNVLAVEAKTWTWTDTKEVVKESAADVATVATYGLGIWAAVATAGVLIVLLSLAKQGRAATSV